MQIFSFDDCLLAAKQHAPSLRKLQLPRIGQILKAAGGYLCQDAYRR